MARVNGSPTTSDCLSYQWAHIRDAEGPIKKRTLRGGLTILVMMLELARNVGPFVHF